MRPTATPAPTRFNTRRLPAGLALLATVAALATLPADAAPTTGGQPPAGWPAVPAACASCGVVESVAPVAQAGRPSGLGAVAGAVIGGVVGRAVGREIGGNDHHRLLGWLGAIGGGLLGHELEKQHRAGSAAVDVTLRMTDGSHRVVRQPQAPTVGTWVRVDGDRLVPLDMSDAPVQTL